jgi:nicotinate phosphoribosyltransferase
VFRRERDGIYAGDVLAGAGEVHEGRPLLEPVMEKGTILPGGRRDLEAVRRHAAAELAKLPERVKSLETDHAYEVAVSEALEAESRRVAEKFARRTAEAADAAEREKPRA